MKFERQTIYKKYHANKDPIYILVLSTGRIGMTYVHISNKAKYIYDAFSELYIEDLDAYVSIERITNVKYDRVYRNDFEKYRQMSNKEMRRITSVMKELFDGDLVYDNDGKLRYLDEINTVATPVNNDIMEIPASNEAADEQDRVDENPVETTESEECVHDEMHSSNNTIQLLKNNGINVEEAEPANHETYVDLLTINSTDIPKQQYERPSSYLISYVNNMPKPKDQQRRWFTESEALNIAMVKINMITSQYDVSIATAVRMKLNARKYFGMDNKKQTTSTYYYELFDQGLSVDDVIELYPDKKYAIRKSYSCYMERGSQKSSDYKERFEEILERDDISELCKLSDMSIKEFTKMLGCTKDFGCIAYYKIRNILSKNIFFVVFGSIAYNETEFAAYIEKCKNSDSSTASVDLFNYETCRRLRRIYNESIDYHYEILTGDKPIPAKLNKIDRRRFMNILKRKYNKNVSVSLDDSILNMVKHKNYVDFATTMMLSYDSGRTYVKALYKKHFDT